MTFGIGRGFAEVQILKTVNFQLLNRLEYFENSEMRLRNEIFHRSRICRVPNSEKK